MRYLDGTEAALGDTVEIDGGGSGKVVACIDIEAFGEGYAPADWRYLETGLLVETTFAGLVHYTSHQDLVRLIARAHG